MPIPKGESFLPKILVSNQWNQLSHWGSVRLQIAPRGVGSCIWSCFVFFLAPHYLISLGRWIVNTVIQLYINSLIVCILNPSISYHHAAKNHPALNKGRANARLKLKLFAIQGSICWYHWKWVLLKKWTRSRWWLSNYRIAYQDLHHSPGRIMSSQKQYHPVTSKTRQNPRLWTHPTPLPSKITKKSRCFLFGFIYSFKGYPGCCHTDDITLMLLWISVNRGQPGGWNHDSSGANLTFWTPRKYEGLKIKVP